MRRIDKGSWPIPPSLKQDALSYAAELAKNHGIAKQRAKGEKVPFAFSLYKREDVRSALETMFHGKCAYCESRYCGTQPVDVEHFRPKSRVAGAKDFPGYWWLAGDWDNLLPSCIDCNRARRQVSFSREELQRLAHGTDLRSSPRMRSRHVQGKADAFPLLDETARADGPGGQRGTDQERPCLINPTEPGYRFRDYFRYDFSSRFTLGVLMLPAGISPDQPELDDACIRALQTIETCGLNRLALLQSRHRTLIEVDYLINIYVTAVEGKQKSSDPTAALFAQQERTVLDALLFKTSEESEYCHMVRAYLDMELGALDWS